FKCFKFLDCLRNFFFIHIKQAIMCLTTCISKISIVTKLSIPFVGVAIDKKCNPSLLFERANCLIFYLWPHYFFINDGVHDGFLLSRVNFHLQKCVLKLLM